MSIVKKKRRNLIAFQLKKIFFKQQNSIMSLWMKLKNAKKIIWVFFWEQ